MHMIFFHIFNPIFSKNDTFCKYLEARDLHLIMFLDTNGVSSDTLIVILDAQNWSKGIQVDVENSFQIWTNEMQASASK